VRSALATASKPAHTPRIGKGDKCMHDVPARDCELKKYGVKKNEVNWRKFGELLRNFVTEKMTYLCDLECTMVGGLPECLVQFENAVKSDLLVRNLYCTKCQFSHFDKNEWVNSHRTHLCL
jgi:hypothetical protein